MAESAGAVCCVLAGSVPVATSFSYNSLVSVAFSAGAASSAPPAGAAGVGTVGAVYGPAGAGCVAGVLGALLASVATSACVNAPVSGVSLLVEGAADGVAFASFDGPATVPAEGAVFASEVADGVALTPVLTSLCVSSSVLDASADFGCVAAGREGVPVGSVPVESCSDVDVPVSGAAPFASGEAASASACEAVSEAAGAGAGGAFSVDDNGV